MWKSFVMNQGSEGVREGVVKQSKARRGLERRGCVLLLEKYCSASSFHFPHFLNSQTWIFSLTARGKPRCSAAVTDTSRGSPRPHTPRCGFLSPQHKKHRFPFRLESKPTAASLTHPVLLGNYRRPPPFVRTSTAVLLVRNSSAFSTSTSTPRVLSKSSRKLCFSRP